MASPGLHSDRDVEAPLPSESAATLSRGPGEGSGDGSSSADAYAAYSESAADAGSRLALVVQSPSPALKGQAPVTAFGPVTAAQGEGDDASNAGGNANAGESDREGMSGLAAFSLAGKPASPSPTPLNVVSEDVKRRRRAADRAERARSRRRATLGGWAACRQRLFSIRGLVILVSVIQVGGAVAFSWGLTFLFGRMNVESLGLSLVQDMHHNAAAQVANHLTTARTLVLRTKAEFDSGRLSQGSWRAVLETCNQNLALHPATLTTYVRFTDRSFLGAERCDKAEGRCPTGYWSTVNNGTFLSFFSATERGQPVEFQFGSPFLPRPNDWYAQTMASPVNATWSDLRTSANPKTDPLENLVVSFSAAIRPRLTVEAAGGPVPANIPGAAPAPAPAGWAPDAESGAPPPPVAGAVGAPAPARPLPANIPVGTLSRILARLAPVPEALILLTTSEGRMVASSTGARGEILDERRAAIAAGASPNALARALFAELTAVKESEQLASFRSGGRDYFGSVAGVHIDPDLDWRMFVAVPRDVLLAQINAGLTWTTVANSLWLLLCVVAAVAVSWIITKPLAELRGSILLLARTMTSVTRELRTNAHAHASAAESHPPLHRHTFYRHTLATLDYLSAHTNAASAGPASSFPGDASPRAGAGAGISIKSKRAWFKPRSWLEGGGSSSNAVAPAPAPPAPDSQGAGTVGRRTSAIASTNTSDTEEPVAGTGGTSSPYTAAARVPPTREEGSPRPEANAAAETNGLPTRDLKARQSRHFVALNTGLSELSAFESLMADVHSRFTAFQELSTTETALLKTLLAERKTKLEMEVRSEETKKFLATMSHEMRTPLNGILGMLQLAQECEMSRDAAEYVDAAALSGEHLLSLVNDVLDLQKIEAGAIELQVRLS
eukprot:tig00000042_g15634.t1